jgi:hypothetical protein
MKITTWSIEVLTCSFYWKLYIVLFSNLEHLIFENEQYITGRVFTFALKCVAIIFVWENKQKCVCSMVVTGDTGRVPAPRPLAHLPTISLFQAMPAAS